MSGSAAAPGEGAERWTILEMIRWSADYLQQKGIESGRLDAEHLLAERMVPEAAGPSLPVFHGRS